MRTTGRLFVLAALLILWGCGGGPGVVGRDGMELASSDGGMVPVSLVLDMGTQGGATARTITPDHIPQADWEDPAKYKLTLSGSSDMGGSVSIDGLRVSGGRGGFDLAPGSWDLTLTATPTSGNDPVLSGGTSVIVHRRPVTVPILLEPLDGTTGTVSVEFTLPQSVVKRLDPQGNTTSKQVTVALYDQRQSPPQNQQQPVANTQQSFQLSAANATSSFTYTAGGPVAAGQYELRLTLPYTVTNASTNNTPRQYDMGWADTVHVEGNRRTTATVTLTDTDNLLGIPSSPHRRDKVTATNVTAGNPNFTNSTPSNPHGEGVWLYGAAWDGQESNANGNEVLVVDWDPVHNADYYEVEVLVHPFTRAASQPASNGRFNKVVTTDADWDALRNQSFNYNGQTKTPTYLRYSGGTGDTDHYKTKTYEVSCVSGSAVTTFTSCADKPLAKRLFTGTRNGGYRVSGAVDAFDNYGNWMYSGTTRGKVGLEGDCGVLGVLLPAYTPQMSVVFRVRAVNEYGHSDWVYWKGGKW